MIDARSKTPAEGEFAHHSERRECSLSDSPWKSSDFALPVRLADGVPVIELTTFIAAPIERVFDLSLSIELHTDSTSETGERAVAGVTSGLIGLGEEVTWRARHFGVWQHLSVKITAFDYPTHFTDTMLRGAFRRMAHHHYFERDGEGTKMRDLFTYESPLGFLGRVADALFLERYMRSFLLTRNRAIKQAAESDGWKKYLAR